MMQAVVKSVEDFVKTLDAELDQLRRTGEQHLARLHSGWQPLAAVNNRPAARQEEQTGLGLHVFEGPDGYMMVKSVVPDGACSRSGQIHDGDSILSLDGIDVRGKVPPLTRYFTLLHALIFRKLTKGSSHPSIIL